MPPPPVVAGGGVGGGVGVEVLLRHHLLDQWSCRSRCCGTIGSYLVQNEFDLLFFERCTYLALESVTCLLIIVHPLTHRLQGSESIRDVPTRSLGGDGVW
jgi:hypothetical protein